MRVIVPYLGGGFGSKSYTKMEPVTVALARKAGRPVRVQNRVDESMATTRRHGMRCRMRTAMNAEGRLLGRDVECWFDTGAYADNGPRVTATGGDAAPGPYRWEAFRVGADCVYTNTAPSGSYRAFGATHLQWIGEQQVDELSRLAGLDPLDVRRQNLCVPGEELRHGGKPLDADLVGDVEKAAAAVGWGAPKPANVGRGVSVGLLAAGAHPGLDGRRASSRRTATSSCSSARPRSGRARGRSSRRSPPRRSACRPSASPCAAPTRDSPRTIARPARAARRRSPASRCSVRPRACGRSSRRPRPASEFEPEAIAGLLARRFGLAGGELIGHGEVAPTGTGSYAEGPVFWEVCVGAAEVEVDPETGIVRVRKTATVADVGKAINPLLVERQDEGGTMQGLGNALFEELVFDGGHVANDTLLEYRVPSIADLPDEMTCVLVENEDGPGPYGAKGCGEGSLAATVAAIVNALADAGVPMNELPLTPERVWRRIEDLKEVGKWPR